MAPDKAHHAAGKDDGTSFSQPSAVTAPEPPAWEQIESGRYMPRRVRGSYRGRELG
jgi:hypothetical protein